MMARPGKFDPGLLRRFIERIGVYPSGREVRLTDGRLALVESQGEGVGGPVVRILSDLEGYTLPVEEQPVVETGGDLGVEKLV